MIAIKTEKDIQNIKLGDSYYIDSDIEDPIEFEVFFTEIQKKIDEHISSLSIDDIHVECTEAKALRIKEEYTVKELKAIIKAAGIKGYSRLKEDELIELILKNDLL